MFGSRVISARSISNLVKPLVCKKIADVKTLSRSLSLVRTFTNSTPRFSANAQELVSVLEEQIEAEKELSNVGATPPEIPGFQISTKGAEVRLTKSHGADEKITVVFNVNHSVNYEGEAEEYEPTEEDEGMTMSLPQFSVQVVKGDKQLCFEMDLAEMEDGQYCGMVEEFYIAPLSKDGQNAEIDMSVYSSTGKFIDPSLNKLLFESYLQERGITDEFCNHLVNFSTYYEHSQYVNLLDNIKSFISKTG
uniref:Uncharacterized protein n=1 Tax=Ditylenchus dipsaci TaxID=166011 RepID=A0A915D3D2_9BILA